VGLNIKALGADAVLCAVIGNDPYGDIFRQLLAKRNMSDIGIFNTPDRPTTVKTRVIASSQHLLRVDEEVCSPIDENVSKKFIQHTTRLIDMQNPDAIIFEDYDKGNITPEVIRAVVKKAKQLNIPVLVDPKKRNFFDYKGVTLFKPNFKELAEGMKISISKSDTDQVTDAANALRQKLNADYVMVTLSEAGVLLVGENQVFSMPAQKREIADVSGAGDTVISVLACCFAANVDTRTSTVIANIAGGLVCENVGVVPIDKEQLLVESTRYFKANSL
jgi:rfaE bifunctional protein kinase chain/domain